MDSAQRFQTPASRRAVDAEDTLLRVSENDRETALAVLAELERLERSKRHLLRLQEQLHAIVDELGQSLR